MIHKAMGFVRFGLAGLVSLALIVLVTSLLKYCGAEATLAYAVALVVAFFANFVTNRHLVFGAEEQIAWSQLRRYTLASLLMRAIEWAAFALLHRSLPDLYLIVGVQAVSTLIKYELYGCFVFRRPRTAFIFSRGR